MEQQLGRKMSLNGRKIECKRIVKRRRARRRRRERGGRENVRTYIDVDAYGPGQRNMEQQLRREMCPDGRRTECK